MPRGDKASEAPAGWPSQRGVCATPKLVTLSNALLAATDARGAPDRDREPERWGAWVENACLAHAVNAGQTVGYWREGPWEVDVVLESSWGDWVVEVKTGGFTARRAGAEALVWEKFLLDGPRPEPAPRTSRADTGRR